ncbi:hypothetical protein HDV00_010548, partial [Rhizophlyctis rosea]
MAPVFFAATTYIVLSRTIMSADPLLSRTNDGVKSAPTEVQDPEPTDASSSMTALTADRNSKSTSSNGASLSPLPPHRLATIFVSSDVTSFLVQ